MGEQFNKTFAKMRQKHENNPNLSCLMFKNLNFAQIQENFAQTCVCTSETFRTTRVILTVHKMFTVYVLGKSDFSDYDRNFDHWGIEGLADGVLLGHVKTTPVTTLRGHPRHHAAGQEGQKGGHCQNLGPVPTGTPV